MKKIIVLVLIILFVYSFSIYAIGGHISIEYDTISGLAMTEVDVQKQLYDFNIGIQLNTYLSGISLKDGWMPFGMPQSQFYRGYLNYKFNENITFTLSNQCRHFFSQSHIDYWNDTSSIVVGAKYEF